mmetsp:Transcript_8749/g.20356  ORF Transcript_8749/g.20356 Transcript_8749/m.20356 type:complete len:205 (-) Transcript_8749:5-619(-)
MTMLCWLSPASIITLSCAGLLSQRPEPSRPRGPTLDPEDRRNFFSESCPESSSQMSDASRPSIPSSVGDFLGLWPDSSRRASGDVFTGKFLRLVPKAAVGLSMDASRRTAGDFFSGSGDFLGIGLEAAIGSLTGGGEVAVGGTRLCFGEARVCFGGEARVEVGGGERVDVGGDARACSAARENEQAADIADTLSTSRVTARIIA